MSRHLIRIAFVSIIICSSAMARQRSLSGLTAADIAEMQKDCSTDARLYCGESKLLIGALEGCLSRQLRKLSPACRHHIGPTDFRKYHKK